MFSKLIRLIFILIPSSLLLFPFSSYASHLDVDKLSLEEKIGQMLMVHFQGEIANEDAQFLIEQVHVGGFIYYSWANGLHSYTQVLNLSNSLQTLAANSKTNIPLFIAIDQEGGRVTRLKNGFSTPPSNEFIGNTHHQELAKAWAQLVGSELAQVGINVNLAPVVDVNSNPNNPVIGPRAFSSDPEEVALFGEQALQGYAQAGIIATLKHFPGHGDTSTDSHLGLPIVQKTPEELSQVELLPFQRLAPIAPMIMTAHLMLPAYDQKFCATLSAAILKGILRNDWGYEGVIITDSLVMEGLLKNCEGNINEAVIRAVEAGNDILLLGGKQLLGTHDGLELNAADVQRIHQTLTEAVLSGRLREEDINASVKRILKLKREYLQKKSYSQSRLQEQSGWIFQVELESFHEFCRCDSINDPMIHG